MQLFRKLDDFPAELRGGAMTIGNFDGVHRGHARIVEQLKARAAELSGAAIVFTFDPHPVRLLRPDQVPPPLTWTDRKADLLAELGVDAVVAYPTDQELLELSYIEFFERIICGQVGAQAMVEGPNFFFGHNREGNVDRLGELCQQHGIQLQIVEPFVRDGDLISSSMIRTLIHEGDVAAAARFLTHPYRIRGMVTHGASRGAAIGFPTANLDAVDTLVPAMGVYVGRAYFQHRPHWAAIHIGPSPTFGDEIPKVEVHILDFERSLYGRPLEVDFVERLRDIRQFESAQELINQLERDVARTREIARSITLTG